MNDSAMGWRRYCGRWLVLLVVIGMVLVFFIFQMLFNAPGHGATVIEQHPVQAIH